MKILRPYQDKIVTKTDEFLFGDNTNVAAQVYSPTGSGKTECFLHTVQRILDRATIAEETVNIAILHPRIALSQDQLGRFRNVLNTVTYTSFHSGGHVLGDGEVMDKHTTDIMELLNIRNKCGRSHITFSSYNSFANKLTCVDFDYIIFDEAHNLLKDQFRTCIEDHSGTKALLFTATPITHISDEEAEEGVSAMENVAVFGEVIAEVLPRELFPLGYMVAPLIHSLDMTSDLNGDVVDPVHVIVDAFKQQEKEMSKTGMPFTQMLVASRGLSDMREVEERLTDLWERLGKMVDVYTVDADNHTINGRPFDGSRMDMLNAVKNSDANAIVIHYDTLAEGIDISSLTGVLIMRNLSKQTLMQTIGRTSRPYVLDLDNKGEVKDMFKRLKQFSIVTLPQADGKNLYDIDSLRWIEAFASAGYDEMAVHYQGSDTTALSDSDEDFNIGDDEDPMMAEIVSHQLRRDARFLATASGF